MDKCCASCKQEIVTWMPDTAVTLRLDENLPANNTLGLAELEGTPIAIVAISCLDNGFMDLNIALGNGPRPGVGGTGKGINISSIRARLGPVFPVWITIPALGLFIDNGSNGVYVFSVLVGEHCTCEGA